MSNNCASCNELREHAPDFVQNGVTDDIAESLQNNNGLNPKKTSDNCTDLNLANDCLIGQMAEEVNAYGTCDWPIYAKKFVPNVYQMLKGIINSICGLWDKISGAKAFIRYCRNNGYATVNTWEAHAGDEFNLDFYMNANGHTNGQIVYGNKVADRDYVVLVQCCTDFHLYTKMETELTWYSSADTRSLDVIRRRTAQHPAYIDQIVTVGGTEYRVETNNHSWTTTGMVLVKKGAYVKMNLKVDSAEGSDPHIRVHQIAMTWIPVEYVEIGD